MMIQAVLGNPHHPEYGVATIPFPIPRDQHAHCMELLEALEASTYCTPTSIGGFPQVSGIEFTVDTTKAYDQGEQYPGSTYYGPKSIQRVTIETVGGEPFDANATYTIATNDFMAAGGDTYYAFAAASVNYDLGLSMDEVVMDYITDELKGTVTEEAYGQPAGRITVDQGLAFTDVAATSPYYDGIEWAVDEGITDIVCTSHATPGITPFPTEKYLAHFAQAQQWCSENQLPITLHTGCEILYTDASPHLLKEGHYPSLAETWTVLVEFSGDVPYSRMCEAARLFGNAGFTVIFAHVERFDPMRNFKHVRELREEYGVYMQMNANTVLKKKGFFADRWTRKMLDEGYIDCIATDAHNTTSRPCRMRECFEKLKASYGVEAAEELCGGFQRRLLNL